MEQWKKYRWHILFPIALTLAVLIISLAVQGLGNKNSLSRCLSLGEQCLNKMDYAGAILQFTNSIAIDPNNRDARIGLAEAYNKSGQFRQAEKIIKDVLDENNPDPELAAKLIEIYTDEENFTGALSLVENLIRTTDDDKYQEMLYDLLKKKADMQHPFSVGAAHELSIVDGVLYGKGNNLMGQLGSAAGNTGSQIDTFTPTLFPATPARTYAFDSSTFVIDEDGNLWGCGDNSFGTAGMGYAAAMPEFGWNKLSTTKDAAAVAGAMYRIYLLKTDGTLWVSDSSVGFRFTRARFPYGCISQINTSVGDLYVLTTEGDLYLNSYDQWRKVAERVSSFAVYQSTLVWVSFDGNIGFYQTYFNLPDNWSYSESNDGTYKPSIEVKTCAYNQTDYYFLDVHGNLYKLSKSSNIVERAPEGQEGSAVLALYQDDNHVYIVRKDTVIVK